MKSMVLARAVVAVVAFATAVSLGQEAKQDWTYGGKDGPKKWGSIKPEYQSCKLGHTQSPIDIKGAKKATLPAIQFDYKPAPLNIVNNGHSIQVNYPEGSWITVGDKKYQLKQFHFHHPSEEHVNGKPYDMVAHLVHADADGKLAVVAVLLKKGSANAMVQKLWENLPKEEGKATDAAGVEVNPSALLPATTGYYTFMGSLTTPPCSEEVTWLVLKTPVEVSAEEVAAFAKVYPNNARPIQPTNGREIRERQ